MKIIASRPPEGRPTGTPQACRANCPHPNALCHQHGAKSKKHITVIYGRDQKYRDSLYLSISVHPSSNIYIPLCWQYFCPVSLYYPTHDHDLIFMSAFLLSSKSLLLSMKITCNLPPWKSVLSEDHHSNKNHKTSKSFSLWTIYWGWKGRNGFLLQLVITLSSVTGEWLGGDFH